MEYEYCFPTNDPDYWREIEGYDAEDAAKNAGEHYDEGDHALVDSSIYVLVREIGSETSELFCASAEPDIHYSASPVSSVTCKQCSKDCIEQIRNGKDLYDDQYCSLECYNQWHKEYYEKYCKPTPPQRGE